MRIAVIPARDQGVGEINEAHQAARRPSAASWSASVAFDHGSHRVAPRPLLRPRAGDTHRLLIVQQRQQHAGQRPVIVRWDEQGGAVPQFAQAWDVAQHQRHAGLRSFQDAQPERLVSRRRCKQRRFVVARPQRCLIQLAKRDDAPQMRPCAARAGDRSGRVHRRADPGGRAIERGDILAFIPKSPDREHRALALRSGHGGCAPPVVNDGDRPSYRIGRPKCVGERRGRRDHRVGLREASRSRCGPPAKVFGQGRAPHRSPPSRDAGMRDGDDRHGPAIPAGKGGRVKLREVDRLRAGECREPACRIGQGPFVLGRPVERQPRFNDARDPASFRPLHRRGRGSEHRDHGSDAAGPQPVRQLEHVSPHAAHGVGREQHAARCHGKQAASKVPSGSGAPSWMSLKRSNCPR